MKWDNCRDMIGRTQTCRRHYHRGTRVWGTFSMVCNWEDEWTFWRVWPGRVSHGVLIRVLGAARRHVSPKMLLCMSRISNGKIDGRLTQAWCFPPSPSPHPVWVKSVQMWRCKSCQEQCKGVGKAVKNPQWRAAVDCRIRLTP